MTTSLSCMHVLASSGNEFTFHHGLLFLIVCLAIGAASKHFLKIVPIPLPFTVFLLVIGLVMGAFTRDKDKGTHGEHGHGDPHASGKEHGTAHGHHDSSQAQPHASPESSGSGHGEPAPARNVDCGSPWELEGDQGTK